MEHMAIAGVKIGGLRRRAIVAFVVSLLGASQASAGLSAADRDCANKVTVELSRVAMVTAKSVHKCLQGHLLPAQSIEACTTADNGGKVTAARDRLREKLAAACATTSLSTLDPDFVSGVAVDGALALAHSLFGADLDDGINTGSTADDEKMRKCQLEIAKRARKCQQAKLRQYRKCKVGALVGREGEPLSSLADLRTHCLTTGNEPTSGQPDPAGKIAKACVDRLTSSVEDACAGVDLARALAHCAQTAPTEAARCADVKVECEVCKNLNAADGLIRDCDLFDNGRDDDSCVDPKTPRFTGIVFSSATDVDEVTLAWAPAADDQTPPENMLYEVHVSRTPDFEPTAATLHGTLTGAVTDHVTGLDFDTTYHFAVVAIDEEGRRSTNLVYATEITPEGPVLFSDTTPFEDATVLGLGEPTIAMGTCQTEGAACLTDTDCEGCVTDTECYDNGPCVGATTYTYQPAPGASLPTVGAVIVGPDVQGGYLRRVESVTQIGGEVVVETSDASLADAVEELSLSATHQLIDPQDAPAMAGMMRQRTTMRANGERVTSLEWPDGLLRVERIDHASERNGVRVVPGPASGRYTIQKGPFTLDVDLGFRPQFVTQIKTKKGWLGLPTGIKSAAVIAKGTLTTEAAAAFGLLKDAPVAFESRLVTLTYTSVYALGPVPVYQEIQYRLSVRVSATPADDVGANATARASAHAEAGIIYDGMEPHDDDGWKGHQVGPDFDQSFTTTIQTAGRVVVEVRLIPRIDLRFYHIAGGYVSFEPFVDLGLGAGNADHLLCGYTPLPPFYPNGIELTSLDATLGAECWAGVYIDIIIKTFSYNKKLFAVGPYWLFSLPSLNLLPTGTNPPQLLASVTNGVNDSFAPSSARWRAVSVSGPTEDPVTVTAPAGSPYEGTVQCSDAAFRNVTVAFTGYGVLGVTEKQCVTRDVICPICNDGVTDAPEQCDSAGESAACDDDCTPVVCGDGNVNEAAHEICDDGNTVDTDACARCQPAVCGDGFVQEGVEQCDDRNNVSTDPCISCRDATCGDGFLCSDGSCTTGPGGEPERCDDGNTIDGDACTSACGLAGCGNGVREAGEECDDGNDVIGDGCDDGPSGNCTYTRCGNGVMTAGEECDNGPANSNTMPDACRTNCLNPRCGDAVTDSGEDCDDGNTNEADFCRSNCEITCYFDGKWGTRAGPNAVAVLSYLPPQTSETVYVATGSHIQYFNRLGGLRGEWVELSPNDITLAGGQAYVSSEIYSSTPFQGTGIVDVYSSSGGLVGSHSYIFDPFGDLGGPRRIAVDQGNIYAAAGGAVQRWNGVSWASLLSAWSGIESIAVGPDGSGVNHLYLGLAFCRLPSCSLGQYEGHVFKYTLPGLALVADIGTGGALKFPAGIEVGRQGALYVADVGSGTIQVFEPNGARQYTVGSPGTGDGQFSPLNGNLDVAVCEGAFCLGGTPRTLYVTDYQANRVQRFVCDVPAP